MGSPYNTASYALNVLAGSAAVVPGSSSVSLSSCSMLYLRLLRPTIMPTKKNTQHRMAVTQGCGTAGGHHMTSHDITASDGQTQVAAHRGQVIGCSYMFVCCLTLSYSWCQCDWGRNSIDRICRYRYRSNRRGR